MQSSLAPFRYDGHRDPSARCRHAAASGLLSRWVLFSGPYHWTGFYLSGHTGLGYAGSSWRDPITGTGLAASAWRSMASSSTGKVIALAEDQSSLTISEAILRSPIHGGSAGQLGPDPNLL